MIILLLNLIALLVLIVTVLRQRKVEMDIKALKASFTKFAGDFNKFSVDLRTFLGNLPVDDPADVQAVADITASLDQFDTTVNDLDSKLG